jgi:FKBP-type peptidyl-prolyl cis-trans isomerase
MKKKLAIILAAVIIIIVLAVIYFNLPKNNNMPSTATASLSGANQNQGIKIEILQPGTGEGAKAGDYVTVNYAGSLPDGTKFDSSFDRGQPFSLTLGQNSVIRGWELGLIGMKAGERRKLTIPPELAYGSQGAGGVIPPNATLVFEIDMMSIN